EDGIRDDLVTGVQTCALPISGMIDTTAAPRSAAYSTERTVQSTDSAAGTYGAPSSTNTRRSMPCSERNAAAAVKRPRSSRLLSRSEERRVGKGWRWQRWV